MPEVFRRVGWALVVFGAADTALLLWSLQQKLLYPSPFNVLAIAAGVMMIRGSVAAAAIVRWTVAFTLAATLAAVAATPLLLKHDFLAALWRLHALWCGAALFLLAGFLVLFAWMQFELERAAVRQALTAAGKRWRLWAAALVGAASVALLAFLVALILRGDFAQEATARAHAQLGPGWHYQVVALGVFFNRNGPYVSASVAGWNEREMRLVPLRWDLLP